MKEKLSPWEKAYRKVKCLWGLKPEPMLMEYSRIIPKGYVLDLGIGEGRNSLTFAELGYQVEGFDISSTAIKHCIETAKKANLKIKAKVGNLKNITITKEKYTLIIAAWVLNFFKKADIAKIITRIRKGVKKNGFVYISVFSLDDPGYRKAKDKFKEIETNTFYLPKRDYFTHYFTKNEILSLFDIFKVIYCAEGTELDMEHGEPHNHGFIIYLGQKVK